MSIGGRIAKLRTERGWSMRQLAEQAKLAVSAISQFEAGDRKPSMDALSKLADALGVSADFLIGKDVGAGDLAQDSKYQVMFRKLQELPPEARDQVIDRASIDIDWHLKNKNR